MKRRLRRIALYLVLGSVTTMVVAWGLAVTVDRPIAVHGYGLIEYGDVAWQIHVHRDFGATRIRSNPLSREFLEEYHDFHTSLLAQSSLYEELITRDSLPAWSRARTAFDAAEYEWSARDLATEEIYGWPSGALRCTVFPDTISWRQTSRLDPQFQINATEVWWIANDGDRYSLKLEPGDGVRDGLLVDAAYTPSGRVEEYQVLPLRPILSGFVIDTLFYALLWCGLFSGVGVVRRRLRRRRGRCPSCGYDLQGNSGGDAGCPECGWGRHPEAELEAES